MKKMKKLLSVIMAMALVLSLSVGAFAAQGSQTITVKNTIAGVTVLELYQVATYTYDEATNSANTVSINNAYKTAFVEAINAGDISDSSSDTDIMLWITEHKKTDSDFAKTLAEKLEAVAKTQAAYATSPNPITGTSYVFNNVDAGYYLILDVTPTADQDYTYGASLMLQPTTPNVEVTLKSSYDKAIEKEIVDHDNSYNVGDTVSFKVTGTVPNRGDDDFTYTIVDTMTAGLTLVDSSVKVDDLAPDANAYTAVTDPDTGVTVQTFTFTQDTVVAGQEIVITYSATVNEAAANKEGNTVFDRYDDTDYNGTVVDIYTFDLKIIKHNEVKDADGNPIEFLEGVTFALKNADGKYMTFDLVNGVYVYTGKTGDIETATGAAVMETNATGEITIHGIDEGAYKLEELETLPGYNKLTAPIDVTVVRGAGDAGEIIFVTTQKVENTTGLVLPGTGGIGTELFTVIGSVMMMGAAAFLFLNKKRIFN